MGMAATLFNGIEPFEQIGNTLLTKVQMWNMVKIAKAVSEKKIFKNYTISYMFNPGASTDNSQGTKFE